MNEIAIEIADGFAVSNIVYFTTSLATCRKPIWLEGKIIKIVDEKIIIQTENGGIYSRTGQTVSKKLPPGMVAYTKIGQGEKSKARALKKAAGVL